MKTIHAIIALTIGGVISYNSILYGTFFSPLPIGYMLMIAFPLWGLLNRLNPLVK